MSSAVRFSCTCFAMRNRGPSHSDQCDGPFSFLSQKSSSMPTLVCPGSVISFLRKMVSRLRIECKLHANCKLTCTRFQRAAAILRFQCRREAKPLSMVGSVQRPMACVQTVNFLSHISNERPPFSKVPRRRDKTVRSGRANSAATTGNRKRGTFYFYCVPSEP